MASLKIEGISDLLDGVYDVVTPSTRELMHYRQDTGISPDELSQIMISQGIEMVPVMIFSAMMRAGKPRIGVADQLIDMPADVLNELLSQLPDLDESAEDENVPPQTGLAAAETTNGEPVSHGGSSESVSES